VELIADAYSCTAAMPSRHLVAYAQSATTGCDGGGQVWMLYSHGPETVRTDRGAHTGMTPRQVQPIFPGLDPDRVLTTDYFSLVPKNGGLTAWPSAIWTLGSDGITAFTTTVIPISRPGD
jgi:hypothetical protein